MLVLKLKIKERILIDFGYYNSEFDAQNVVDRINKFIRSTNIAQDKHNKNERKLNDMQIKLLLETEFGKLICDKVLLGEI